MIKDDRRSGVVQLVERNGSVSFAQIKLLYPNTSDMTLRSDLKALDEEGRLVRVHGGAKSIRNVVRSDDLFFTRTTRNIEKKRQIAQKALTLLKPKMSIFMDCGTTAMELTRVFPDDVFHIVTNSVSCVLELSHLQKPDVYMLGGSLNRFNLCLDGVRNREDIERMNFDITFLAVTGYTSRQGFTCGTEVEDDMRQAAMRRGKQVVALMDSTKVGKVYAVTYASLKDIDVVISDDELDPEIAEEFRRNNIKVY